MNWKTSLDRYLTTPPDDGFDSWAERVIKELSPEFYNANAERINSYGGQFDKWLSICFTNKGYDTKQTAKIIERAFSLYKVKNNL